MPEICLPLRKRPCHTTLGPGFEVGGRVRQWVNVDRSHQEIASDTLEGGQSGVTVSWLLLFDQEDEIIYSQLDDARYDRALLRARCQLFRWMLAIRNVPRAYHLRGLRSWLSSPRSLKTVSGGTKDSEELKTQMIELQRQQGPAKDPAEPELPEEASSSS
ncbi:hypothetical protein Tco_0351649 [Tanacetum coccineum]